MSYHKFSNLSEIFQGDLNNKFTNQITSKDKDNTDDTESQIVAGTTGMPEEPSKQK